MKIKVEMKTIYKNTNSPLKATATVLLEDCFVIRNVKVIESENAMFLSMPSYRGRDGVWRSICHPITSECRQAIQSAVFDAYFAG